MSKTELKTITTEIKENPKNNSIFNFNYRQKITSLKEKLKYNFSPISYKILYDKYCRPEIYNSITHLLISNFKRENILDLELDYFPSEFKISNVETYPEILVLQYYHNLFEEITFISSLLFLTFNQYAVYKISENLQWEKRRFIFLDNNRALFNKIAMCNIGFSGVAKFMMYMTFFITSIYTCKLGCNMMVEGLEEEAVVMNMYKRSEMLYNKL